MWTKGLASLHPTNIRTSAESRRDRDKSTDTIRVPAAKRIKMTDTTTTITTIVKTVTQVFNGGSKMRGNTRSRAEKAAQTTPERPNHPLSTPIPPLVPAQDPTLPSVQEVPESSHLETNFSIFENVLLQSDPKQRIHIRTIAEKVVSSPSVEAALSRYLDAVRQVSEVEEPYSPPDLSEDRLFMEFSNEALSVAPVCGLTRVHPQSISFAVKQRYAKPGEVPLTRKDFSSLCTGVLDATTSDWAHAAVLIEVDQQRENYGKESTPKAVTPSAELPQQKTYVTPPTQPESIPLNKKSPRSSSGTSPSSPSAPESESKEQTSSKSPTPHSRRPPPVGTVLADATLQVFSAIGNRRHVIGLLVQGTEIQLRYFDRAGCISSRDVLDLRREEDVVRFVAALASISNFPASSFGLEPAIIPPDEDVASALSSIVGSHIVVQDYRFEFERVLHSSHALYGRGTVVYAARPIPLSSNAISVPDDTNIIENRLPDLVVVKLSWQTLGQESEERLLRLAAQYQVQGIAKLHCSSIGGKLSGGLRGRLLPLRSHEYTDRELRVQVMGPLCVPLYKVSDLGQFKAAYISLVKAHHDLYEKAGILHRDISINNLMVEASNHSVGILIDLDLAAQVRDGTKALVTPVARVGTLPFLSVELLGNKPPAQHLYRHDLEAFYYTLVWTCVHHDHGRLVDAQELAEWRTGERMSIMNHKSGFLQSASTYPLPAHTWLRNTWIVWLADIFESGYFKRMQAWHDNSLDTFDSHTLGGVVTFDTFMSILLRDM